jgi:hypothetical protein
MAWIDGGTTYSFTAAGDAGTPQAITDGNTLTIAGGTGISTSASATDTVTITNTGVTSLGATTPINVSAATGSVTVSSDAYTGQLQFLRTHILVEPMSDMFPLEELPPPSFEEMELGLLLPVVELCLLSTYPMELLRKQL